MSKRSGHSAAVIAIVVVIGLTAWWKSVGLGAALIAVFVAAGCFVIVDWGLSHHVAESMLVPTLETWIQGVGPARGGHASGSMGGRIEEVESSSDARCGQLTNPHQSLMGDADPGDSGSMWEGRLFWVRVPKHGNSMAECEDAVAWSPDGSTVVVSDGAGSSFGAAAWASVLANRFVAHPPTALSSGNFASWLQSCRVALAGQGELDAPSDDWWVSEGSRRGAFATIAGARLSEVDGRTELLTMCVGDSCVIVVRGDAGARRVVRSVPFDDAKQFGSHPMLVGSPEEAVMREPSWTTIRIEPGDRVLVASDAVSEWLLGDPSRVNAIDLPPVDLAKRLRSQRSAGLIVNDDLAIVGVTVARPGEKER